MTSDDAGLPGETEPTTGVEPVATTEPTSSAGNGANRAGATTIPTTTSSVGVNPFGAATTSTATTGANALVPTVSWHQAGGEDGHGGSPWLRAFDYACETASDWLNPILVKEARQALKSRQFTTTFGLMLVFALVATVLGVALQSPGIFYAPSGPVLAVMYYLVLTIPTLLIVPFQAFRSLAGEREEGTFDMLQVSTLDSRHIAVGKLGSAVAQILVYYSALGPCVAFTYMLRGLDVYVIGIFLAWLFLASLALSATSIVLATMTKTRAMQIVMSVAIVVLLVVFLFVWFMMNGSLFFENVVQSQVQTKEFWHLQLAILTFTASFVWLMIEVAAAQLSFASDNHSTSVRWVLVAQTALAAGWVGGVMLQMPPQHFNEISIVFVSFLASYAMLTGIFLTSEEAELSPRVRRDLPSSLLGRAFLTLLNPGPGTGYFFTLANLSAFMIVATVVDFWRCATFSVGGVIPGLDEKRFVFMGLVWCYLAGYLGVGRLLIAFARRWAHVNTMAAVLIQILLSLGMCVACPAFSMMVNRRAFDGYDVYQIPNWIMALGTHVSQEKMPVEHRMVVLVVAILIVAMNVLASFGEFLEVKTAVPGRVEEEERAQAANSPDARKPKNPWESATA